MPRTGVVVAVVLALLPATYLGARQLFGGGDAPASSGTHKDLPIPPVTTPPASPTSTPSVPVTPPPSSTPAAPALTRVPADVPRRILSPGLLDVGLDDSIEPARGTFTPASTAEAARWGSRGEPGSPGTDTVFLIGKTNAKGTSAFDTLPQVKVGGTITIRTDAGTLTYTVSAAGDQPQAGIARTPAFAAKVPGRLVLVGIRYARSGDRTGQAFVVTAQLSRATRK
ncbi:MAG: hypothetical protein ACJ72D_17100 [Marmoricola sp.]